ncbi:MAG: gamma carbonic anhydrase family protein [Proteobacteria bacterium]|nr:gamma carbonic anhydrase family protein [Pseudomonadota bacterium]
MQIRYQHYTPEIGDGARFGAHALVAGRTTAGPDLRLEAYATVRADGEAITLGADTWLGTRATVHIAHDVYATTMGDGVTVGRYGLVHACTLGDGVVVADAATVMDGATLGAHALVMPGSVVPPRKTLAGGMIYAGSPAVPVRAIERDELARYHAALRRGEPLEPYTLAELPPLRFPPAVSGAARPSLATTSFVAATAALAGRVELDADASIYFACVVDAGDSRIALGRRTNVQDNSFLVTDGLRGELVLGNDVTVGHNVRMGSGRVADRCLIGMGAIVGDHLVMEEGACIAAGAHVAPGTHVPAGWIYAGRPARPFRELKGVERDGFADIVRVYAEYSAVYAGR